jgi:shikimate O-hydroxycinnamoyltransferase
MINFTDSFLVQASQPSPQRIKCALSDHFAFRSPISMVFLYREHISKELLIESLKIVLNDFPIFAGILTEDAGDLYIDCNNQGVKVTVAHAKDSLLRSLDLKKINSTKFVTAISPNRDLKQKNPLLQIQLTYYDDGMVIGYCWHHSVGDMHSFMNFLKALSLAAQKKAYPSPIIPTDRSGYLEKWLAQKNISSHARQKISPLTRLRLFDFARLLTSLCIPQETVYLYFSDETISHLKKSYSEKAGQKLSRNDVLCSYLLDALKSCCPQKTKTSHLSMLVNMRPRLGMSSDLLGNYVDLVTVPTEDPHLIIQNALAINSAVRHYLGDHFQYFAMKAFVEKNGGIKKIGSIMPEKMLPKHRNLTISNWSNFGVYSIDFGIQPPYLVLPLGRSPLPWVSCIVEGFENKGYLVTMVLPSKIAKKMTPYHGSSLAPHVVHKMPQSISS